MPPPLYLYTSGYPYDGARDRTFIEPELGFLAKHFEQVVLVPYRGSGEKFGTPSNVMVDDTLMTHRLRRFMDPRNWLSAWLSTDLRNEIQQMPNARRAIWKRALTVMAVARWSHKFSGSSIHYTHSLDSITLGLVRGRSSPAERTVVSRCIGSDVNENQKSRRFIPFKGPALKAVDHIFPCSEAMTKLLSQQYPKLAHKMVTTRMGVPDPEFVSTPSRDGVRRVVSCGAMIPLKRYDLLAQAMVKLARRQPGGRFEWRHIPLGPPDKKIIRLAKEGSPANLNIFIEDESISVMGTYQSFPADLFVHTSCSEGIPLVVMEALSCGLPVLATDVGGVSELVDSTTGGLMPALIDAEKLTDCLWVMLQDSKALQCKKKAARNRWKQRVNSDSNYARFAKHLASLLR